LKSDCCLDANPGELRRRCGKKECGQQPESSSPAHGFGRIAWHWALSALLSRIGTGARLCLLSVVCGALATSLPAAEPAATSKATNSVAATVPALVGTNAALRFDIRGYVVKCDRSVFPNAPTPALSQYTGSNVSLQQIVRAAASLLLEYQKKGYRKANISIARELITNGIVTMNVYQGVFPQVLISGRPCFSPGDAMAAAILAAAGPAATNATTAVTTNAPLRLNVQAYEITGDTLLSTDTLMSIFAKHTGTNVPLPEVLQAASDLQMEYRNRGYPTVNVTVPPQTVSNGLFKIRVFQGRLAEINVVNNRYFSSNNIMRTLPSMHTNMILVDPVFQAELDRANANQDRTIYGQLEPGPTEGTTTLDLRVKDRLPLHAKIDFNNQNSPGTPDLRVNASMIYDNLWQYEHSIGVQYAFSPTDYKSGSQWSFYDLPLVANYGGFYRLPLGSPAPMAEAIAESPGSFGYSEATRKFNLPPPSGQSELNFYASRSTIDTGVTTVSSEQVANIPNQITIVQDVVQQDITINSALGSRLTLPLPSTARFQSSLSGGLDYKTYDVTTYRTNVFVVTTAELDSNGHVIGYTTSIIRNGVPTTKEDLGYLPLALRYNLGEHDALGSSSFGLGLGANAWYSGSASNLHSITSSSESSGHWLTLSPSLSRDFLIHTNWVLSLHAEGQWANEPLISNEQFGLGGVNSIRGYQEGQVFGDTGWWVGLEQKTPPKSVGLVYRNHPLTVRGSVYMEYGESYLLDPQGRQARTPLWGTGFGAVSTIGATWEVRLLVSWPLLDAGTAEGGQPRFNFSLSAQF